MIDQQKRFAFILLLSLSLFFLWGIELPLSSQLSDATPIERRVERTFQAYTVRVTYNSETYEGQLEILRYGQRICQMSEMGELFIGHMYYNDPKLNSDSIQMGRDITGDGIPDLLIAEYTGGVHCCLNFYVFMIGQEFRFLGKIEANDSDYSHFEDIDHDQSLEFIGNDWTFAYWHTGFASSPAPSVILYFHDGAYRLAGHLMSKPIPSQAELDEKTREIQADESWTNRGRPPQSPPVLLWDTMLELIYSGHANVAWQFFDVAWVGSIPGKEAFLADFRAQLMKSPYWQEIEQLNQMEKK